MLSLRQSRLYHSKDVLYVLLYMSDLSSLGIDMLQTRTVVRTIIILGIIHQEAQADERIGPAQYMQTSETV